MKNLDKVLLFKILATLIFLVFNVIFYTCPFGYEYTAFKTLWVESHPALAMFVASTIGGSFIGYIYSLITHKK